MQWWFDLQTTVVGSVGTQDLDKLYIEMNQGAAAMSLMWAIWSIVQSHLRESSTTDQDDFNYVEYAIIRYGHYKALKEKFC